MITFNSIYKIFDTEGACMDEDTVRNRETAGFKKNISESGLSVDELQLRELVYIKNELRDTLKGIKHDLHFIYKVVLALVIIIVFQLLLMLSFFGRLVLG